ncbi:MAG: hypothetical protein QGH60_24430, partial [Phycisphaerae bacterium]|nr:hypothetical protein [Phycisphaerae bacterium]
MNNVLRIMTVIVISTNTLPSLAAGGEIEQGVKRSIEQLASKAREAKAKVANALGKDFDKQVAEAMSTLKEDPRNLKLQLKVCEILIAQVAKLSGGLRDVKQSDLVAMKKRVVDGLVALAEQKQQERDNYLARAKNSAMPEMKKRYESLGQSADRLYR